MTDFLNQYGEAFIRALPVALFFGIGYLLKRIYSKRTPGSANPVDLEKESQ